MNSTITAILFPAPRLTRLAVTNAAILLAALLVLLFKTFLFLSAEFYNAGCMMGCWWYQRGQAQFAAEIAPCVQALKDSIAWVFGIDRLWSAKNLPATVGTFKAFLVEVAAEYRAWGQRAQNAVDGYLLGA